MAKTVWKIPVSWKKVPDVWSYIPVRDASCPETGAVQMKVQILLSAYNGEPFLREQLDSIVSQTIGEKSLLIRDDGSVDATCNILKKFCREYPWIRFYQGSNIGVRRSYLELIQISDPMADYMAFSDQDDIWFPEKLARAVRILEKLRQKFSEGTPLLYCSDARAVDEKLKDLPVKIPRIVQKTCFGNALVQNICTGCTAVANRALMDLLREHLPANPEAIVMHDWWLYLTAACFGKVFYDKESRILYRQHGKNTSGIKISQKELIRYRLERLGKPGGEIYRQAGTFLTCFGDEIEKHGLTEEKELLNQMLQAQKDLGGRLRMAGDHRYFRQKRLDDLIFRGAVLMGKL